MELFRMILHVVEHSFEDCIKMLPFLFAAFLILEAVEHYAKDKMEKALVKIRYGGPIAGAVLGCVPQCGFSIIAAGLYSGGMITRGTLLSVFLATSDEAVLILLGQPGAGKTILPLLGVKILIAVAAGYLVDLFGSRSKHHHEEHDIDDICVDCESVCVSVFIYAGVGRSYRTGRDKEDFGASFKEQHFSAIFGGSGGLDPKLCGICIINRAVSGKNDQFCFGYRRTVHRGRIRHSRVV